MHAEVATVDQQVLERGEIRIEVVRLRHDAHAHPCFAGMARDRVPGAGKISPASGAVSPSAETQRGGLARAVRSEQTKAFAGSATRDRHRKPPRCYRRIYALRAETTCFGSTRSATTTPTAGAGRTQGHRFVSRRDMSLNDALQFDQVAVKEVTRTWQHHHRQAAGAPMPTPQDSGTTRRRSSPWITSVPSVTGSS